MAIHTATVTNRYFGPPGKAVVDRHQVESAMNVIYPLESVAGPMPKAGWPAVIFVDLEGFHKIHNQATSIDDTAVGPQGAILKLGMALVLVSLPPVRGPNLLTVGVGTGNYADSVYDLTLSPPQYGPAYRGNGVWPPQSGLGPKAWPDEDQCIGYAASHPTRPTPWLDPLWLCSAKSIMWAVQHCRYNGIGGAGKNANQLLINPGRIGAWGTSAGAVSAAWAALQPDRAGLTGDDSGQGQMSTRLQAAVLHNSDYHAMAYENVFPGIQYPEKRSVSGNSDWDEPAVQMSDVDDGIGGGVPETRAMNSPSHYGVDEVGSPGITALNRVIPIHIGSGQPTTPAVLALPTPYVGNDADGQLVNPAGHQVFHSYKHRRDFNPFVNSDSKCRFVLQNDETWDFTSVANNAGVFLHWDARLTDAIATAGSLQPLYDDQAAHLATGLVYDEEDYEPVEETVVQAFVDAMASIKTVNGFLTDVKRVFRYPEMPSQAQETPAIIIDEDDTNNDDKFEATVITKWRHLEVTVLVGGWQKQSVRLERLIADVEKKIYSDHTFGGLTVNAHIDRVERKKWKDEGNEWAAAKVNVRLQFRHVIGDPYTPYPVPV